MTAASTPELEADRQALIGLINAEAVFHGISDEAGVDVAMRLGVNYPVGPLAWGRTIGLPNVLRVLENLCAAYGEDRYRASVWLRREVDRQAVRQGA